MTFRLWRCFFITLKGCLSEIGIFSFGRALSSQPTPYHVHDCLVDLRKDLWRLFGVFGISVEFVSVFRELEKAFKMLEESL